MGDLDIAEVAALIHDGAEGRRQSTDGQVQDADDAEVNGVNAQLGRHGIEQRHRDHQNGRAVHEHTHDEQDHVHNQQPILPTSMPNIILVICWGI